MIYALLVILGAVFVIHSLVYCIPGDPAQMIAGEYASAADIDTIRTELDLNKGFFARYGSYVFRLFHFDLGLSRHHNVLKAKSRVWKFLLWGKVLL